jgi:multidrug efflux pump subunit AcrA (membrane-fusion protein)
MFKKRILLFALALAGAVAALQLTRGTANETPIKPPPYEPATRDKDGLIAAAGLIEAAAENTLLGSPTSGTVTKVHVKVWDKVKAGDPILTLDERDLRAQHAVQKAAVSAAEATAERAEDAARRWKIANRIRKMPGGASDRLLEFLRENVGLVVTTEELAYVAKDAKSFARRVRELRTEQGFMISTKFSGRPDLKVGQYVLETTDRRMQPHDRSQKLSLPKPKRNCTAVIVSYRSRFLT